MSPEAFITLFSGVLNEETSLMTIETGGILSPVNRNKSVRPQQSSRHCNLLATIELSCFFFRRLGNIKKSQAG